MAPSKSTPAGRQRRGLGLLLGLAALGALVFAVLHFGDARGFLALLRGAQPKWLALAFALQLLTYATEAGAWQGVLSRAGVSRPFLELYTFALVGLFTNQMIPAAGVAGSLVIVRAMESHGVPHDAAVSAVLVDLIAYYMAFGAALGFALAVLWVHHDLSPIVLGMAAGVTLLGVIISVGALRITAPGRVVPALLLRWGPVRRAVASLRAADSGLLRDPRLLARAAALRTGNFACDGLTLWACAHAIRAPVSAPEAVAAFLVGALARTLGILPGGLGTFEAGAIGGLALFGVAVEPALAATLLFRGLSLWLPMLPGLWLGRRLAAGSR